MAALNQNQLFTNNATATLSTGITGGTATIALAPGTGVLFPQPTGTQFFMATMVVTDPLNPNYGVLEIVKVTGRSTDTVTVVRAQEGTSAFAFPAGSLFELRPTALAFDTIYSALAERVPTFTSGTIPVSNVGNVIAVLGLGLYSWNGSAYVPDIQTNSGAGQYLFRNKLINSLGFINQRNYTSGTATTGANQYTLDRWRVVTSGQNLTFTTVSNYTQMTAPAGGVEQVIEGSNMEGGNYVLTWIGTATATVNGASVSKGVVFTLPARTNCTVRFTNGTFGQPQFELNRVTPYEYRGDVIEMPLCQRYFQISQVTHLGLIAATGAGSKQLNVAFSVPMRTNPTMLLASVAPTPASVTSTTQGFRVVWTQADTGVASFTAFQAVAEL